MPFSIFSMKILVKAVAIAVLCVCKTVAILDNKNNGVQSILVESHPFAVTKG